MVQNFMRNGTTMFELEAKLFKSQIQNKFAFNAFDNNPANGMMTYLFWRSKIVRDYVKIIGTAQDDINNPICQRFANAYKQTHAELQKQGYKDYAIPNDIEVNGRKLKVLIDAFKSLY